MYNDFYGFSEEPFNVTPDPRFLYLTPSHREALASMMYGIKERKGFISITGEVGTGKTTLIHTLLMKLDRHVKSVFIFHTHISFEELLKSVLTELDIPVPDHGKAALLNALNQNLIGRLSKNENVALIIDEAQNLGKDVLEELRQLSNLETPRLKLLQIVLVGQPELEAKLNSPELRQLKERIGIRRRIEPLSPEDCEKYIDRRLKQVGSSAQEAFTKEAIALISGCGRGIPRRINTICDNALLIGYGLSRQRIDGDIVREVMKDLGEGSPAPPEPLDLIQESAVAREIPEIKDSRPGPMNRPRESRTMQYLLIGILLLAFAVVFFLGGEFYSSRVSRKEPPAKPLPTSAVHDSSAGPPATEERKEQVIYVKQGDSIFSLALKHYRASNETLADMILEANPGIININWIVIGQKIKIPEISDESLIVPAPERGYRIYLGTFAGQRAARIFEDEPGLEGKGLEIIQKKVSPGEDWYRVLTGAFESREECLKVIGKLKIKRLLPAFSA